MIGMQTTSVGCPVTTSEHWSITSVNGWHRVPAGSAGVVALQPKMWSWSEPNWCHYQIIRHDFNLPDTIYQSRAYFHSNMWRRLTCTIKWHIAIVVCSVLWIRVKNVVGSRKFVCGQTPLRVLWSRRPTSSTYASCICSPVWSWKVTRKPQQLGK